MGIKNKMIKEAEKQGVMQVLRVIDSMHCYLEDMVNEQKRTNELLEEINDKLDKIGEDE